MARVLIIGGGICGLGIGWQLAKRGHDVRVYDRGRAGRRASWAAAGMLSQQVELRPGYESLRPLLDRSSAMWPDFAAELESDAGLSVDYATCGTVLPAVTDDEHLQLRHTHRYLQTLQPRPDVSWVDGEALREQIPLLSRHVRGGLLSERDHQVDNRKVIDALAAALRRAGGQLFEHTPVTEVIVEGGVCRGLRVGRAGDTGHAGDDAQRADSSRRTRRAAEGDSGDAVQAVDAIHEVAGDAGRVDTSPNVASRTGPVDRAGTEAVYGDAVIVAAGAWSRRVPGIPQACLPPVRPVKGQMLALEIPPACRPLTRVITSTKTYLAPKGDRLIVGATVEEEGFDVSVTSGGLMDLLFGAYQLLPASREWRVLETWAGLRPGTDDNEPILGPSGIPGLTYATGHYRNGILLAPVTARGVADYVESGALDPLLQRYTMQRFAP